MSVINVDDVTMCYKLSTDKIMSFKGFFVAKLKNEIKHTEHLVFSGLNFEVEKGDVVGIIGRNGAGKSTLLKIIAGVLSPTKGEVKVNGNIVPMLELGSGFDFDLTGRENIFLNGAILGYSESFLKEKYDEIVEFSELGEFIEQPIRNYSSGMIARLAFAIATVVEPEILIVDEILAVGDEAFQKKSKKKMISLMGGGCTVLFVSHSIGQIREMCTKVLWLEDGKMRMFGDTKKVCDAYQEFLTPKKIVEDNTPDDITAQTTIKKVRDVLYVFNYRNINYYYRVGVGKEQLLAVNIQAGELNYKYLTEEYINKNNIFIFEECPATEELVRLIKYIKESNKTVIFDITSENDQELPLLNKVYDLVDGIIVSDERLVSLFEEKDVLVNPYCASDRIMQLCDWAVYDRDVLPFIDEDEITSEDMQLNFNRAKSELNDKNEYAKNICLLNENYSVEDVGFIIDKVCDILKEESYCRLITTYKYRECYGLEAYWDRVKFISKPGYEDIPKVVALSDEIICFIKDGVFNSYDEVLKGIAGLTKTAVRSVDLVSKEQYLSDTSSGYEYECHKHAIYRGRYIKDFIGKYRRPTCGILVDTSKRSLSEAVKFLISKYISEGYILYLFDYAEKTDYEEVYTYKCSEIALADNYIGMIFDCLIATDYIGYNFVNSYIWAKDKYYLVEEYEPNQFEHGNFNRFLANQSYNCIGNVKYMALREDNKHELTEKFGIDEGMIEIINYWE